MRRAVFTILLLLLILISPSLAEAATHWVSPTGAAAYSSCIGASPLSGTAACSLATANSNAAAGDLVYLRGGTYDLGGTGTGIIPTNSGTAANNMITFQAYTAETPIIQNGQNPFWLSGNNYVSIKGITFQSFSVTWGRFDTSSHHNEIANCTFIDTNGGGKAMLVTGANGQHWVTHNWIHGNTFSVSGQATGTNGLGCTDGGGDVLDIGVAQGTFGNTADNDNNNTVEDNVFGHAPHTNWDNYGMFNVFRNNVVHNEPWSTASAGCAAAATYPATYSSSNPNYTAFNGKYSHRNFQITEDYNRDGTFDLVEGNRSGYAGVNDTNNGADGFSLAAPENIVRYNFFYAAMSPGLLFKYARGFGLNAGGNGGTYNRVYNNTMYQNGYGYPTGASCGTTVCPWAQSAVSLYTSGSGEGNVLKNNILYLNASYSIRGFDLADARSPSNGWGEMSHVANNWCSGTQTGGDQGLDSVHGCSATGDPKFTNPDLTNFSSTTLPDLSLQATSTAIDGGTFLTTATNSGASSTTLTVADALYFQDGTWGSDLSRPAAGLGGTMQADWIAIGTVTNTVQISSITYGAYNAPAGTITLANPMTWSNGAQIWLYKKSDGVIVLNGTAPDYGASESSGTVNPPGNLTVTAITVNQTVLSWVASSTGGVTYNVYRTLSLNHGYSCPTSGTWPLIASGVGSTAYTDNSVAKGIWCYQITAFLGSESSPDTPVSVIVPPQIVVF